MAQTLDELCARAVAKTVEAELKKRFGYCHESEESGVITLTSGEQRVVVRVEWTRVSRKVIAGEEP